jgi:hypothetical protein
MPLNIEFKATTESLEAAEQKFSVLAESLVSAICVGRTLRMNNIK